MKIKDFIKELQNLQNDYGSDLEVILSVDPEGNSYSTTDKRSFAIITNFTSTRVLGVCIYPWEENFDSPEEACVGRE